MQSFQFPGVAGQSLFRVPHPFSQAATDLAVTVDGVTAPFTMASPSQVQLNTPLAAAALVVVTPVYAYETPRPPVTAAMATVSRSATFSPVAGRPFNITISGTFVATVWVERSLDGGATWSPISKDTSGNGATYTAPAQLALTEPSRRTLYSVNCTARTSGTVNVEFRQ